MLGIRHSGLIGLYWVYLDRGGRMNEKLSTLIISIGFIISIALYFFLGAYLQSEGILEASPKLDPNKSALCYSDSLSESAYCLKEQVEEFYNYNLTNKDKTLTDTQLKEIGGVCKHYAEYYKEKMLDIGFYAKTISFPLDKNVSHMIAIASVSDSYCVLDQLSIDCYYFPRDKIEIELK